jgi:hypothetical protein
MSNGYTFDSFAGLVKVSKSTLYKWVEKYPEFAEAKEIAFGACLKFWEEKGIDAMNAGKSFSAATWIFNMKARFKWNDKGDGVDPGTTAKKVVDLKNLSDNDLEKLMELANKAALEAEIETLTT